MTRVRKAAAVALMTSLAAGALAVSETAPAGAASSCFGLSHATINDVTTPVFAGSSVHVTASVSNMLLGAHLQISGPGLNKQVGDNGSNGTIGGDVTIPQAGYFTLSVLGNGTHCTYDTSGFTAKQRPGTPSPTQRSSAPHKTSIPSAGGRLGLPGSSSPFPGITPGGGNAYALPFNGSSPFSLPSVAPDGSALGFNYPTPDPQVASPPAQQVVARDVSQTTPITWGRSVAIALVLLLLSAHLGMWSRRQRLATAGGPASDDALTGDDAGGRDGDRGRSGLRSYRGRRRRG